jgi:hypothetical protein
VVRRTNAQDSRAGLPAPDDLDAWLRGTWSAFERIVEVDRRPPPAGTGSDPRLGVGHHLHNYAAYLATHPDNETDLLAAVELFENVVIPARELYWRRTHSFLPLRQSLQLAAGAATALSRLAGAGRVVEARCWAGTGLGWIRRALQDRETTELLARPTEPAAHFCLVAVRTMLAAVETGVPDAGLAEVTRAGELLAVVRDWARRVTDEAEQSYVHYDELLQLQRRLEELSGGGS